MAKGLEAFLKKIAGSPTNDTYIDRFLSLLIDEPSQKRMGYYLRMGTILVKSNPMIALKVSYMALQEARAMSNGHSQEIQVLEVVKACFTALGRDGKAELIGHEMEKLRAKHSEWVKLNREKKKQSLVRRVPSQKPAIPQVKDKSAVKPEARDAKRRIHFPKQAGSQDFSGVYRPGVPGKKVRDSRHGISKAVEQKLGSNVLGDKKKREAEIKQNEPEIGTKVNEMSFEQELARVHQQKSAPDQASNIDFSTLNKRKKVEEQRPAEPPKQGQPTQPAKKPPRPVRQKLKSFLDDATLILPGKKKTDGQDLSASFDQATIIQNMNELGGHDQKSKIPMKEAPGQVARDKQNPLVPPKHQVQDNHKTPSQPQKPSPTPKQQLPPTTPVVSPKPPTPQQDVRQPAQVAPDTSTPHSTRQPFFDNKSADEIWSVLGNEGTKASPDQVSPELKQAQERAAQEEVRRQRQEQEEQQVAQRRAAEQALAQQRAAEERAAAERRAGEERANAARREAEATRAAAELKKRQEQEQLAKKAREEEIRKAKHDATNVTALNKRPIDLSEMGQKAQKLKQTQLAVAPPSDQTFAFSSLNEDTQAESSREHLTAQQDAMAETEEESGAHALEESFDHRTPGGLIDTNDEHVPIEPDGVESAVIGELGQASDEDLSSFAVEDELDESFGHFWLIVIDSILTSPGDSTRSRVKNFFEGVDLSLSSEKLEHFVQYLDDWQDEPAFTQLLGIVCTIFEAMDLHQTEQLFQSLSLDDYFIEAWGDYLEGLMAAGRYRVALKKITSRIEPKSKLPWVQVSYDKLQRIWMALGYRGFQWEPEDGVRVFWQMLRDRPLPSAATILSLSS
ncbi:hypothetical protein [Pseudobacteriovorax antillogorgiicola]|uniref:Uncharacterized protein n=1 Tax=Pseudobacteriovorax antillogorgiicola TaxID=1513793 RepID=A0A1Y6B7P3_9BACT|nr:hypothetical protein [Pseudobacteriovorax antillogorgiicola]TCS58573.1 hypothetical protein EDD56_10286 [Pseudobacteriovorax antillogorgiicola]SME97361.1 hypothetical protein SAMN06296036_102357 [Pseudobacteriovorax antillogorgiicola]